MTQGKLLGIDHGLQRIGIAVSDALRISAREITIIERRSKKEDFAAINAIATRENVVGVVIGLPLDLDAPPGIHTQADTVRLWAERYAATTDLPITLQDEQLSSEEATAIAIEKKRRPRDPIDHIAARIILQRYLDAVRDGLREGDI
jgi:putative holliday junction resolvase